MLVYFNRIRWYMLLSFVFIIAYESIEFHSEIQSGICLTYT